MSAIITSSKRAKLLPKKLTKIDGISTWFSVHKKKVIYLKYKHLVFYIVPMSSWACIAHLVVVSSHAGVPKFKPTFDIILIHVFLIICVGVMMSMPFFHFCPFILFIIIKNKQIRRIVVPRPAATLTSK